MERPNHITRQLGWALGLSFILGLFASSAGAGITIDLVTVGDPGNAGELSGDGGLLDPLRICGAVPYVYQIGKYEVTKPQYRAFLNSVARYGDPYNLHSTTGEYPYRGITRSGSGTGGDPYVYLPTGNDPNWDTRPVNYVSWYSSLRFVNWLQNGQPLAEAGPGVTETGTYTFSDPSTVTIPDHASLTAPHYVLPTEDEWYKAAYYKSGGTAAGYWDFATQSDTLPNNNPPELDTGNSANYKLDDYDPSTDDYAVGPPYYMTDVGAYSLSESPYGTYDQNGNAGEILESPLRTDGPRTRVLVRGGSWDRGSLPLAYPLSGVDRDAVSESNGFRVALVPEPSMFLLLGAGAVPWVVRRGRR